MGGPLMGELRAGEGGRGGGTGVQYTTNKMRAKKRLFVYLAGG